MPFGLTDRRGPLETDFELNEMFGREWPYTLSNFR